MEVVIAAIVTSIPPLLGLVWRDIKRHTNGQGPIAQKLDCIEGRIIRTEHRLAGVEDRAARIEENMLRRKV